MSRALLVILIVLIAAPAGAQTDPLRCWWRTSEGGVAIGEPFVATLTCAVREQEDVRTVPDESRLGAAVIQLAPFEVLDGSHPSDLRSPTHRFLQYHYTLRILNRDVIGHDATLPDLQVAYRVDARVNGEWVEGRARAYVLSGGAVRVLSLVPAGAADIRDSDEAGFARVETLRFRSRALQIASVALVALGLILGAPALWALVQQTQPSSAPQENVPRRAALRAADLALERVAQEARAGWTPELVGRGLAALRVAAATALARPVAHHGHGQGTPADGGLIASVGRLRRRDVEISSSMTPLEMRAAIATLPATVLASRRQALDEVRHSMQVFTGALYGTAELDPASLDQALASARTAAERAARQR